jgi:hypothetical protein
MKRVLAYVSALAIVLFLSPSGQTEKAGNKQ